MSKKISRQQKSLPPLSPTRKRLFTLITFLFPFVLLLCLEAGLRIANYGPNIDLIVSESFRGTTHYIMNPDIKYRYFNRYQFNPSTSPDFFLMPKPADTYRIFCFGGSTTVGYPYWYNGAFSTFLRDRLRKVFPDRNIEVLNFGMTATNSFTVNDIADELVNYEPDLFIVYDGHNEFYGALGVASHEGVGRYRWITKLYLKLIHLKTVALLKDGFAWIAKILKGSGSGDGGTMMERLARGQYIPYGSDLYKDGLESFKDNLDELRGLCSKYKIPVIISSQVSNLRNQAPFISQPDEALSEQKRASFQHLMDTSLKHFTNGGFEQALTLTDSAIAIDSLRADTHFRRAQILDTLQQRSEALQSYTKAKDYDQLRFRTSTDFNVAIRGVSDGQTIIFLDVEQLFREHSPDSIIGNELITEHLHPNAYGYFLLAKGYAELMRTHGMIASRDEWQRRDTISEEILWNERALTELDERIAKRRTDILTAGWPFKDQIPIVDPIQPGDTLGQIVDNVTRARWNWQQAHEKAIEFYKRRGDRESVKKEYRVLINQIPYEVKPYLQLSHILLQEGNISEVESLLRTSLSVEKTILAYRALGDIALRNKRPQEAVTYYQGTFSFPQSPRERLENGFLLAQAYASAQRNREARFELVKILDINPDFRPALEMLAKLPQN